MEDLAVVVPAYNEPHIEITLNALYQQRHRKGIHHYIVDNGSTDDTRNRICAFAGSHDDFPMSIINEGQKGTGFAVDTGFRRAINDGYSAIARTDSDSAPDPAWTSHIVYALARKPDIQLIGGRLMALRDEHYRGGDDLLLRIAVAGARAALALQHVDSAYLKAVNGANMATRSNAYEDAGGIRRSSIDELDEDIDYTIQIIRSYGPRAVAYDRNMKVATSMRRIRHSGIFGTAMHHLKPGLRTISGREIDVRS